MERTYTRWYTTTSTGLFGTYTYTSISYSTSYSTYFNDLCTVYDLYDCSSYCYYLYYGYRCYPYPSTNDSITNYPDNTAKYIAVG
jgi:hypothetical protein